MNEIHRYRLFISHAWSYDTEYSRIIQFLNQDLNFIYSNNSAREHDPDSDISKLEEELRQQIHPVQVVIVLAGMYDSENDWIQFEIDYASSILKPILAVEPWDYQGIPTAVRSAADKIVGWNTSSIVSGIRSLAQ
jgi:hypothetical protein